jgi:hypothetical protein
MFCRRPPLTDRWTVLRRKTVLMGALVSISRVVRNIEVVKKGRTAYSAALPIED